MKNTKKNNAPAKLRNIRIPQSIHFLSDTIEDESYASAISLGYLGYNSGATDDLREHMVMSNLTGEIVEFEEVETFRQKQPSSTETRKQLWIPHDKVRVVSFCTRL